jgi:hypothetical protein
MQLDQDKPARDRDKQPLRKQCAPSKSTAILHQFSEWVLNDLLRHICSMHIHIMPSITWID